MRTVPTSERNSLAACDLRQSPAFRSGRRLGTARRHQSPRKRERYPSTGRNQRGLVRTKRVGSTRDCHSSGPSNPTSASNSRVPNTPRSSLVEKHKSDPSRPGRYTTSSLDHDSLWEPNNRTTVPSSLGPNSLVPRSSIGTSADVENQRSPRNPTNSSSPWPSARPVASQMSSCQDPSHGHRSNTHQRGVESRLLRVAALATAILVGACELITPGH